jgi:DNA replication initiation complex subunit (GINS family)
VGWLYMEETLSYDYLWQAYQKEKQTNQLLLVSKTFYDDVNAFLANKTGMDPSLKENTAKLLNSFFERRKQKILIYVAYNKPLPQPVSGNEFEFYNKILQIVKSERIETYNKTGERMVLRSAKDLPEIILPSGKKFGPVKKDQIIESIDEQDKVYLLENSICEQVY